LLHHTKVKMDSGRGYMMTYVYRIRKNVVNVCTIE